MVDARRCLSYQTIENPGPVPDELRPGFARTVFGCDLCQTCCPWNHKAPPPDDGAFAPRPLAQLSTREFAALTPGDLKRLLHGHSAIDSAPGIAIFVTSFSYRHGLPRDADLVLDVRFLRNPHYVTDLAPLTGQDAAVAAYIAEDPDFPRFFNNLCGWLGPLLPRYESEGKSYFTIAVGCTGGRHRSVYVADRLGETLRSAGFRVAVEHRDLGPGDAPSLRGRT